MEQTAIDELLAAWQAYCTKLDWQKLIQGLEPKPSGCGLLYELPDLPDRPQESFAIADMRTIAYAEPHYHPSGNWEFYVVLGGAATVVVDGKEQMVHKGDAVVIPPNTAHFTIPDRQFIIAAISTPPFEPEVYVKLTGSKAAANYDERQFRRLTEDPSA